jgi:hypothetical protein
MPGLQLEPEVESSALVSALTVRRLLQLHFLDLTKEFLRHDEMGKLLINEQVRPSGFAFVHSTYPETQGRDKQRCTHHPL